MLYAPDGVLAGNPNIYFMRLSFPGGESGILERSGDLPLPNRPISVTNLPAGSGVELTMGLFRDKALDESKTHTCRSIAPFDLIRQQRATAEVECLVIGNADAKPIKIFIKVAQLNVELKEKISGAIAAKDWAEPSLFAQISDQGGRVSLRQDTKGGISANVSADLSYYAAPAKTKGNPSTSHLERLVQGSSVTLKATGGRRFESNSSDATLTLDGAPTVVEEDGKILLVLPIKIVSLDQTVEVSASLIEETFGHEFSVVSYNVENLFDQTDEERNEGYGDYRLSPNSRGQSSNYGDPVFFEGQTVTFTDVKIAGIRKALTAIDPQGPEIVALQEIESKAALESLFQNLQDLGYVSNQFTEWNGAPNAIGAGIISKFPILAWELVEAAADPNAQPPTPGSTPAEPLRRSLKVTLDVFGKELVVYNNHWKSKGSKESKRKLQAEGILADVQQMLANDPTTDYMIVGDLNSDYNEKVIMTEEHNNTGGLTGMNDVIKAQGDELKVARRAEGLHYNLHYELQRARRRTAYHDGFGWSSFDHIIIGANLYDAQGITYVDNSFEIARPTNPSMSFLFQPDGTSKRWARTRIGDISKHEVGGFSDHLPIYARFHIRRLQSPNGIWLFRPSRPDKTDTQK
jgi:endonuclease/exonuclease/phosphatase family metal-dependent hydrolase